jgi:ATP synthase subunit 6
MWCSPLEQFEIISVRPLGALDSRFSILQDLVSDINKIFISNFSYRVLIWLIIGRRLVKMNRVFFYKITVSFLKVRQLILLETCYTINAGRLILLPYLIFLMIIIGGLNVIGLLPYIFTVTRQLAFTLFISMIIFRGWNYIGVRRSGVKFVEIVTPRGISIGITFFLVGIEIISYRARVVSLAVRLFANIVAGHSLLKILARFRFIMVTNLEGIRVVAIVRPVIVVIVVFGLEIIIRRLQAYVFIILVNLYLKDVLYIGEH